ncbi:hypothetical protein WICMUC_003247 [Wickerhamomyces mucosus]|uniref:Biogenesis of lysosome-related organelles complex 1 subunit CNL1 n=1 Tax=Wickerhamomyces mucosus TaxID=1378264 RepID=A0A9P8PMU5_9ASCO|nr:hypothetical protein WICMUC_003247 [Wickerhamomyces mucosus]
MTSSFPADDTKNIASNARASQPISEQDAETNIVSDEADQLSTDIDQTDLKPPKMYSEDDDDPLGVKQLAVSFDYLMFKINDNLKNLTSETEKYLIDQKTSLTKELESVDAMTDSLKHVMDKCANLNSEFMKIKQISFIAADFKERIRYIESKLYDYHNK